MGDKLNIAMLFGNVRRPVIIGGKPPIQVTGKVLIFSAWTLNGSFYEYDLSDSNITANSIVEVIPSRHDIDIVQAARIMPEADVSTGSVKLYSKNAPSEDIDITINIHTRLSTTPAKGFFVATAADGEDGTDGTDGTDGDSAYVYIAYASDDAGTDFTTTFDPALDYIAVLATDTEIVSPAVGDFAGLWKNYKGVDASQPIQVTGKSLLSTGWTLVSGLYEYDLADANITANSIVEVIPDNADIAIVKAAEILPGNDSSAGSVKIYSTNEPTADIGVTINITEKQI